MSAEDFAKFLRFKFNSWQPEENETLYFQCRNNCEFVALIDLNSEEYQCPLCNTKVCPKCYDVVHKGSSCEAFRLWKIENGQADKAFDLLLKQSQWVQCPWCLQAIERVSGCQFMTCASVICKGKKYFCFQCKGKLNVDHEPHQC